MPTIIGQLGGLAEYSWVFTALPRHVDDDGPDLLQARRRVRAQAGVPRRPRWLFVLGRSCAASRPRCPSSSPSVRSRASGRAPSSRSRSRSRATSSSRGSGRGCRACSRRSGASPRSSGPALGGLITTTVGWPWVFLINLPVGLLAMAIIWFAFHERFIRRPQRIDWLRRGAAHGRDRPPARRGVGDKPRVRPALAADDRAARGLLRPARCLRRQLTTRRGPAHQPRPRAVTFGAGGPRGRHARWRGDVRA